MLRKYLMLANNVGLVNMKKKVFKNNRTYSVLPNNNLD